MGGYGGVHSAEKQLPPALRTAQRFGDDFFHDPVRVQVLRRQLHHRAGFPAAGGILPQNAGEPLGAEYRIHGVFQHQNMVGNAQPQGTAAGAFPRDDGQHRDGQTAHLHQVAGNGLALSALLGILAGVRAGGVHKSNDGTPEFFCLLHHAQSLAVPLRSRHTKIALQVFLQRGSLAMPQNCDGHPMKPRNTAQNGGILLALAIPALFKEIGKQCVNDLADMRAIRAACQKNTILRRQRGAALQDLVLLL